MQALRNFITEENRWQSMWNSNYPQLDLATSTGGNQYGEPMYCGFAWVNIYKIKGNTKLGRAMKQAGYEKDYTGAYQIYNPAGYGGQSMDVKEAGARAAAKVFEQYGFTAYPGGRAD